MFYTAWFHTPNPQQETVTVSDPRSPAEMGAALAEDGYIVTTAGTYAWGAYSDGGATRYSASFKRSGQVVLFRQHLIRLDEIVVPAGAQVTET